MKKSISNVLLAALKGVSSIEKVIPEMIFIIIASVFPPFERWCYSIENSITEHHPNVSMALTIITTIVNLGITIAVLMMIIPLIGIVVLAGV